MPCPRNMMLPSSLLTVVTAAGINAWKFAHIGPDSVVPMHPNLGPKDLFVKCELCCFLFGETTLVHWSMYMHICICTYTYTSFYIFSKKHMYVWMSTTISTHKYTSVLKCFPTMYIESISILKYLNLNVYIYIHIYLPLSPSLSSQGKAILGHGLCW